MAPVVETAAPEVSKTRVLRGSLILAVGLISAQTLGFLRQVAIGYLLGTGQQADALSAALAPVELWWSVLGVSVVYGFVPKFLEGGLERDHAFGDIFKPLSRLAVASTFSFLVFAEPLVRLFAPGLDAPTTSLAAGLLRVLSLAPAAVGCSFVYTALLFSRRKFTVPSFQHATVNLATVAGAFLLYERFGVYSFAFGYVAGAWIQLAMNHLYALPILSQQTATSHPLTLRQLLASPAPILGQSLAMEMNTAVSRAYASTFGPGMTAAFEYAFKLFRVPLALLVVPLSQSLLPEISSRQGSPEQKRAALRATNRAAWLTALAGAAITVVMILVRRPLVALLFQRGRFGGASTDAVATILLGYMPVLVGRGLSDFLSRALFAMQRFRIPVLATVLALVINLVVCLLLPSRHPVLIGLGAIISFVAGAILIVSHVASLKSRDGFRSPTR